MAKQFKLRRGTTAQHSTFVGASGEVTVDTTKKTAVVHDGATPGGIPLARQDLSNVSDLSNIKSALLSLIYPVGSIYTNATNSTNPGTLLGFGTWVAFGAGRVPVGYDASNSNFNAAEKTGGSADAIVVSHSHSASSSVTDPGHSHGLNGYSYTSAAPGGGTPLGSPGYTSNYYSSSSATTGITVSTSISNAGSSGTNANLQPYITVYMWKRTA